MSDLTEFLLARIAEDEERDLPYEDDSRCIGVSERAEVAAINDYWRARWAAECEAKRAVISQAAWVEETYDLRREQPMTNPIEISDRASAMGAAHAYRAVLLALTVPYADHPDFREDWRPA